MIDIRGLDAVLFDFDGVVVLSEGVYDRATKRLGAHYGVTIPEPYYEANRGVSGEVFYARFHETFQIKDSLELLHEHGNRILWEEFATSVKHTPGFLQFFEKVQARVSHVALVTATRRPLVDEIFKNSDLQVHFEHMITASDVKQTKPHPEPYASMCRRLGVIPAKALAIEDSPSGIRSAKQAGCMAVGITTSCAPESLSEADFVVDSFGELEELLTIV